MDTPYRKLLNEIKGTETYEQALLLPHRARTGREDVFSKQKHLADFSAGNEQKRKGVLMFGKKGNDFVFKIGSKDEAPSMLPAEEALALFKAEKDEQPVELSKDFDAVYQRVKSSLFKSDVQERNDKELVNAVAKIKALMKANIQPKDYLCDLITVIKADALSGYEIRSINQLTLKDAASLPQKITPEYIARIVSSQNKVDDGEETLIMSEELQ